MSKYRLNEETAKLYLIDYFRQKLRLALEDLESERSITVRVGRSQIKVQSVLGRLDILIRRHGRNLCVVELKAEGERLTDEDKKQVMSYAVGLDERAPLVFLTNGTDSQLYDVWGGDLLNNKPLSIDSVYSISPPADFLRRREEALLLFLSLSPANLLAFCREQVALHLRSLRGSSEERDLKYIPELFVSRGNFRERINSFLQAPQPLFILAGDAGIGKTCELCALAESLLEEGVAVLFYRGSTLGHQPLLKSVAEDFAWTFAEEESPPGLIRHLGTMPNVAKVVVIIDAIDEWDYAARMQDLLSASERLLGTKVKLVISCKSLAWFEFAKRMGVPTGLSEFLHEGQPQILPPMSAREQWRAIEKYRGFYGVHGAFEGSGTEGRAGEPLHSASSLRGGSEKRRRSYPLLIDTVLRRVFRSAD